MKTSFLSIIGLIFSVINFNVINAQVSNNGLLAYYPFDGNVNDMGPSSYNGSLIGGSFVNNDSGTSNSALELDGISDYVNLSSFATVYRDNASQLSVYFKIKFIETGNNQTILSLGNSGESLSTNVFEIEYENNQLQVETEVGNATTNYELQIDGPNTLFDNQWHEILITFDNTNLKYYKDGSLIFDNTYVPAVTTATDLFLGVFGGTSSNDCCYAGIQIDELQFYSSILDQSVLSSNDYTVSELNFYPNPVNDIFKIELNKNYNEIDVELMNISGQLIRKIHYSDTKLIEIQLNNLPSGIYFIELKTSNSSLIKERLKILKK